MPKHIKLSIIICTIAFNLLCINALAQQPDSTRLEFSIVTCDFGHDFASAFGHVAIRLKDNKLNRDIIFDYGTFTFNESFFVLKFMRGDLLYYLSIREYERFRNDYTYENRTVTEQKLNLTGAQKIRLFNSLRYNYMPENRFYKYDFITDNCATRIRDIFTHHDFSHLCHTTDSTFRQYINYYLDNQKWLQFGIDVLLGQEIDENASFTEAMFLPYTISANLRQYTNSINNKPLVEEPVVIIRGETHTKKFNYFQPTIIFTLAMLLIACLLVSKRNKLVHQLAPIFYTLISIVGIVMLFMWFGSRYPCTKLNWNVIWALPLYPLLLLPLGIRAKSTLLKFQNTLLVAILLLGWWAIPQFINLAVYPLVATIALINLNEIALYSKE